MLHGGTHEIRCLNATSVFINISEAPSRMQRVVKRSHVELARSQDARGDRLFCRVVLHWDTLYKQGGRICFTAWLPALVEDVLCILEIVSPLFLHTRKTSLFNTNTCTISPCNPFLHPSFFNYFYIDHTTSAIFYQLFFFMFFK